MNQRLVRNHLGCRITFMISIIMIPVVMFLGLACSKPESALKGSRQPPMGSDSNNDSARWANRFAEVHRQLDLATSLVDFETAFRTCANLRNQIEDSAPDPARLLVEWNEQCQVGVRHRLAKAAFDHVQTPEGSKWCEMALERLEFLRTTHRQLDTTQEWIDRLQRVCPKPRSDGSSPAAPSR